MKKRVVVVKSASETRSSIRLLAENMGASVGVFDTAEALLHKLADLALDCVIADLRLPGIDGLKLLEQLQTRGLHTPVIFVSAAADVSSTVRAMNSGAVTVLAEPLDQLKLLDAIQSALRPSEHVRVELAHRVAARRLVERLTRGEHEVLDRIAMGKPNKAIARALGISLRTVEDRRRKIYRKFGVDSLAGMMQIALGKKYVSCFHDESA